MDRNPMRDHQHELDFSATAANAKALREMRLPDMTSADGTLVKANHLESILRVINGYAVLSGPAGRCTAMHKTIADKMRISTRTVGRAIECLIRANLLIARPIGARRNAYQIAWVNLREDIQAILATTNDTESDTKTTMESVPKIDDSGPEPDDPKRRGVAFKATWRSIQSDVTALSKRRDGSLFNHCETVSKQPQHDDQVAAVESRIFEIENFLRDEAKMARWKPAAKKAVANGATPAAVRDIVRTWEYNKSQGVFTSPQGALWTRLVDLCWPCQVKIPPTAEELADQEAKRLEAARRRSAQIQLDTIQVELKGHWKSLEERDQMIRDRIPADVLELTDFSGNLHSEAGAK